MKLRVLESTKLVIKNSRYVSIDKNKITNFCEKIKEKDLAFPRIDLFRYSWTDRAKVNLILIFNTINFSFWAEKGEPKWMIKIDGKKLDGANGLFAAVEQAARKSSEIFEPDVLADLSRGALRQILKGNVLIPMFEERLKCLHETGEVLERRFKGRFDKVVEMAKRNAVRLVNLLVTNFPSFDDSAHWNGHLVEFHKRAQLSVKMIHDALRGKGLGKFDDLEKLTVFADYKLPQILRREEILKYSQELAEKIDNYQEIRAGSCEEIEIRANTIWACEYIRRQLSKRFLFITSAQIDSLLWLMSQRKSPDDKPYHRTRTIFY